MQDLTPEQLEQIPAHKEKWRRILLSTEALDYQKIEELMAHYYEIVKLPPPIILYSPDPITTSIFGALITTKLVQNEKLDIRKEYDYLRATYPDIGYKDLNTTIAEELAQYRLRNKFNEPTFREIVNNFFNFWSGGNYWSEWCNFISFARDVVGTKFEHMEDYFWCEQLTIETGPRFHHDKFVIVSERPETISTDTANGLLRLNNWSGPSISYRNGAEFYHVRGMAISRKIIADPNSLTVEEIDNEQNEEIKSVMLDKKGWLKYLLESKAKVLEHRINPRDQMPETLFVTTKGRRVLYVKDPSKNLDYALTVDSGCATCEQAQLWLSSGLDNYASGRA